MSELVEIDGRDGEGGGQIVRTSVALAALTGRPLAMIRVRSGRANPGLQAQHLTSVKAVATVCAAQTENLRLNAQRFRFVPGALRGGRFIFSVPTAGSAGLVLQAVLPVLLRAPEPSEVVFEGGTHVRSAPSFDHTQRALLPLLTRLGVRARARLERPGFYPKGGGRMLVEVEPWTTLRPLSLDTDITEWVRSAQVYSGKLPEHVGARAWRTLEAAGYARRASSEAVLAPSVGPGFAVTLEHTSGMASEVITGVGEKGTPVEVIVGRAIDEARVFAESRVPVGPHLADQLLVYLALGPGGRFRTVAPTPHFETQVRTLARFVGDCVRVRPGHEAHVVEVEGAQVFGTPPEVGR